VNSEIFQCDREYCECARIKCEESLGVNYRQLIVTLSSETHPTIFFYLQNHFPNPSRGKLQGIITTISQNAW